MTTDNQGQKATLSVIDAVAVGVGMVIGAGIFKTPSLVAMFGQTEMTAILLWLAGGVISLIGALCYAELASAFPSSGGDYHYLFRAIGQKPAFLFAWARMTVIQTGSIAMFGFVSGDYASEILRLGGYSSPLYAAFFVVALTAVNIAGIKQTRFAQNALTAAIVLGLVSVVFLGLSAAPASAPVKAAGFPSAGGLGMGLIFVLLTYGGWNEVAYVSAEVKNPHRNMVRILLITIGVITAIYVAVNIVYLRGLGIEAAAKSDVIAADLMRRVMGSAGSTFISILIIFAALSSMNAVVITGARTNYAMGCDFHLFRCLGKWQQESGVPLPALLLQGAISLALVLLGTGTRDGFRMMVEYTAPVFWLFFFFVGVSLFLLRRKEPDAPRPFRVPLYPFTPALFCVVCLYMLYSSLAYAGRGALIGAAVLVAGIPLMLLRNAGCADAAPGAMKPGR